MPNSSRICGITGATGFIGRALAKQLEQEGWEIVEFGRKPSGEPHRKFVRWSFTESVNRGDADRFDLFVHCAWDMTVSSRQDNLRINMKGTLGLVQAVLPISEKLIFISSLSAYSAAKSNYGKTKLAVESAILDQGGMVIRPGMVVGAENGGMVGSLAKIARISPVIPIPGNGKQRVFTCRLENLCSLVSIVARESVSALPQRLVISAACPDPIEFKDLLKKLGEKIAGRAPYCLPVPWKPIYFGLKWIESLGVRLRIKSDSLLGLMTPNCSPDFSSLERFPVNFLPLDSSSTEIQIHPI